MQSPHWCLITIIEHTAAAGEDRVQPGENSATGMELPGTIVNRVSGGRSEEEWNNFGQLGVVRRFRDGKSAKLRDTR
jgi:hypothetical protein